jgi:ComEC/Rec2-related protein
MLNGLLGFSPIFPTPLDAQELGWGLLLGKDDNFSHDMKQQTRMAGVTHLTAASGANISLFQGLLSPWQGMYWLHVTLEFFIIALYWSLSGASGSLWRASVLALVGLGARMCGRPAHLPWLLCLVVLLALSTQWGESLGFWLSWLAVVGVFLSQKSLSGEKKNILSPQMWGFCKWLQFTLQSGVFVLVLVSIVIIRVFGEWQPQGLIGTIVSSPFVPLYLLLFVTGFLLNEGNKVALHFMPGLSEILATPSGFLGSSLQILLGILFLLWQWVAEIPIQLSVSLIGVTLCWVAGLYARKGRVAWRDRATAQRWGWQL